jgi:hypothetical protein
LNTNEDIEPYMAMLVVWPLTLASSVGGVDAGLQKWFRSELARLGRVMGYAITECAEIGQLPVNDLDFDKERGISEYYVTSECQALSRSCYSVLVYKYKY